MISDMGKYAEKDTYIRVSDGKEEIVELFPESVEFFFVCERGLDSSIEKGVQQEKRAGCFAGKASIPGVV